MRQVATTGHEGEKRAALPRSLSRLHTIAVGTDFSPDAELALEHAIAIAHQNGARLVLIHVAPIVAPLQGEMAGTFGTIIGEEHEAAVKALSHLVGRCSRLGIPAEIELVDGSADHELAIAADRRRAGLLV